MTRGWCGPGRWCAWPGPADARLAGLVAALPAADRQEMAAVVLGEAAALAADPGAGLVERVVARQAAHHVRGDLADRSGLTSVQVGLIRGLETLGDPAAAYDVATAALAELEALPPAARDAGQRQELLMAMLRLARTRPGRGQDDDPVVAEAVELALSGGAAVRPEARVWAAVDLLHRPGRRQDGLRLARQVTAELEARRIHGELAAQWRLLLAFHAGQAGDTALAQRLLATMINTGPAGQQDAAAAVLRAIGGAACRHPPADHPAPRRAHPHTRRRRRRPAAPAPRPRRRLRHARRLPPGAPPRQPGTPPAPPHPGRRPPRHPDHPRQHRGWTGQCGDPAGALRLFQELLPDQVRVLGPDHPDTLTTRSNIANWTGQCGDAAAALRLSQELLPDLVRVLGPDHPDTLTTRSNIASWTGECGDAAGALRLFQELLPDHVRVAGPRPPRHPGHPQQHRGLDRQVRGPGRGAAPVPGAAARPWCGSWAQTTPTP